MQWIYYVLNWHLAALLFTLFQIQNWLSLCLLNLINESFHIIEDIIISIKIKIFIIQENKIEFLMQIYLKLANEMNFFVRLSVVDLQTIWAFIRLDWINKSLSFCSFCNICILENG